MASRKRLLEQSVTQEKDGTWTAVCPMTAGCGDDYPTHDKAGKPDGGVKHIGFISSAWPTKKTATARLDEHFDEHLSGTPMRDLEEFRIHHDLVRDEAGRVTLADLR